MGSRWQVGTHIWSEPAPISWSEDERWFGRTVGSHSGASTEGGWVVFSISLPHKAASFAFERRAGPADNWIIEHSLRRDRTEFKPIGFHMFDQNTPPTQQQLRDAHMQVVDRALAYDGVYELLHLDLTQKVWPQRASE